MTGFLSEDAQFPTAPLDRLIAAFGKYDIEARDPEPADEWGCYVQLSPAGSAELSEVRDLDAYHDAEGQLVVDPPTVCAACRFYGIDVLRLYGLVRDPPPSEKKRV